MTFILHKRQKKDAPLLAPRVLKQSDQCGHKNVSLLHGLTLVDSSLPRHVDECYKQNGSSFVGPNPLPKHVDQKNSTTLHGPSLVDSSNQKNGSSLVYPHPVDEVLALIQSYQMDFDVENVSHKLSKFFVFLLSFFFKLSL
jgi:hypothetical protein